MSMGKSIEVSAKTIDQAIEEAIAQLGVSQEDVDVEVLSSGGMFKKAKVQVTVKRETINVKRETPQEKTTEPAEVVEKPSMKPEKPVMEKPKSNTPPRVARHPSTAEGNSQLPPRAEKQHSISTGEQGVKFTKTLEFVQKLVELLGNDSVVSSEMKENGFDINIHGENVGMLIGKGGEVLNALQTLVSAIAIHNSHGEGKRVFVNVEDYKERRAETLKVLAVKKAEHVKSSGRYVKLEPMNSRDRAIIHTALQGIEGIRTYSTGKEPFRCLCIAPEGDKR